MKGIQFAHSRAAWAARGRCLTRRRLNRTPPGGLTRRLHEYVIARASDAQQSPRMVPGIDKVSWHKGAWINKGLAAWSHLELYLLPIYSSQLQVIARQKPYERSN